MTIFYDYQIFFQQKFGGISRYFYELMRGMKEKNDNILCPILFNRNFYLREDPSINKSVFDIKSVNNKYSNFILNKLNEKYCLLQLDLKNNIDIVHSTYYDPFLINTVKKKNIPLITTIHDLIHEKFLNNNSKILRQKKEYIENSDLIISVSENTKRDLLEYYNIDENKIKVVYHGFEMRKYPDSNNKESNFDNIFPENYILFVGLRNGYKNFEKLVEAFRIINNKYPDIQLICTGLPFTDEENKKIDGLKLSDKIKHYYVSDSLLFKLYENALCFVYPSLYEGFGIPILESFAARCPVSLSNASCFPEVAGLAGHYFDPNSIESIAHTTLELIENKELRDSKTKLGEELLNNFSWDKTVNQTKELYKSLTK